MYALVSPNTSDKSSIKKKNTDNTTVATTYSKPIKILQANAQFTDTSP